MESGLQAAAIAVGVFATAATALAAGLELQRGARRRRQLGARVAPQPSAAESARSSLRGWAERFDASPRGQRLQLQLDRANLSWQPWQFTAAVLVLNAAALFFLVAVIQLDIWFSLFAIAAVSRYGPRLFLDSRRDRYIEAFNLQLAEVSLLIGGALRAGLSVPQAIAVAAQETPPPAGREFNRVASELGMGGEVDTVLEAMLERLPSEELRVLLTAILVQRRAGGDLARALSTLARTMVERRKLAEEVRTATSEVRYSSLLVAVLPVGMLLLMKVSMPTMIDPLFSTLIGWLVLAVFAAMQVAAFLIVRQISKIEV